jgi:hypothetical protein
MSIFTDLLALFQTSNDEETSVSGDSNRGTLNDVIFALRAKWNGTTRASIEFLAGSDTSNKDDAAIAFKVSEGGALTEAWRIAQDGNLKAANGKGIDFSDTADGSGTTTSELFDDYEEGTWVPVINFGTPGDESTSQAIGAYTKKGREVTIQGQIVFDKGTTASGNITITGIPFASSSSPSPAVRPGIVRPDRIGATGKIVGVTLGGGGTSLSLKLYDQGTAAESNLTDSEVIATGTDAKLNFVMIYYTA